MSTNQKESIYVELDVLLDTRLGTVACIDEGLAISLLESGKYHTRIDDQFAGVDMAVYQERYKQRNALTLQKSIVTGILDIVQELVTKLSEQASESPVDNGGKVVVNTYPYELTDAEKDEMGKAIFVWVNQLAPVELVFIAPTALTPEHCKESYTCMFMYAQNDWMDLHAEAFKKTRLPEVSLFAPAIYVVNKPNPEELEKMMKEAAHPMRALEMLASPLVGLKLIDAKYFSIVMI